MRESLFIDHRYIGELEIQILHIDYQQMNAAPDHIFQTNLIDRMKSSSQFQIVFELNNDDLADEPLEHGVEKLLA